MTVAIAGATGFIGRRLANALTDMSPSPTVLSRSYNLADMPNDERSQLTTVFWLATRVNPQLAITQPGLTDLDKRDLHRALRILERETESVRVVLVSSGGTVYDGEVEPPYDEASPTVPATAYGRHKLELEQLARDSSLPIVVIRASNAYGPGQQARAGQGVLAHWIESLRQGHDVVVYGEFSDARDYVFVDDLADALLRAGDPSRSPPPVVNVGSGAPTTLSELLEILRDVVAPLDVRVRHEPGRVFDRRRTWLDIGLAKNALEWEPRTKLADGVAAMWSNVVGGSGSS